MKPRALNLYVGQPRLVIVNKQERHARGARLLDDARFVKDVLLDAAATAGRWNLVVFEAYRVAELLTKGIIYSAGYEPRKHHRLHSLVERLGQILEHDKGRFPFIYKAVDSTGNCYRLRIVDEAVQLLKQIAGNYTQLGSITRLSNPYLPLRLVRSGTTVSVVQGPTRLLVTCDSSLHGDVSYDRTVLRAPEESRLEHLKHLVEVLLTTREEAFYSERHFAQEEGESAARTLATVYELSKAFELYERI